MPRGEHRKDQWNSCRRKRRYVTEAEAQVQCLLDQVVYACRHCNCFHIGHSAKVTIDRRLYRPAPLLVSIGERLAAKKAEREP